MTFGSVPTVSVLLPVRDGVATLASALRSVQRQTLSAFECVVVDDGSRDGTAEIVRAFASTDPRFVGVVQPGAGIVAALRRGVASCRGAFVARMDADDVMRRQRLAAQVAALVADPGLAGVGCHVRLFPRGSLQPGRLAYEAWLNGIADADAVFRDRYVECGVAHPTWCVRAEVMREFPYRDVPWAEDHDLLLRMLGAGLRFGVVPRRLLAWRDAPSRASRVDPRYGLARFADLRAAFVAEQFLGGGEEYVLWGHGPTGRGLRARLARHGKRAAFIVELHPRRIGQRIHGAPVVPIDALPSLPRLPIVTSVSGAGPRALIRAALASMGFTEGTDFVVAA